MKKDKLILAITSDTHINDWTEFSDYDKNGIPSRLKLYNNLADDFSKFSESIGADMNIIAGDISESANQSPMVLNHLRRFLEVVSKNTPTLVTHGQHDIATKSNNSPKEHSILTSLSSKLKNLHYYSKESKLLKSEDFCSKVGYTIKVNPWDQDCSIPEESADIFIGHGMVQNCKNLEGYKFANGFKSKTLFDKFKLSIIGDIHQSQIFSDDEHPFMVSKDLEIVDSNRKILLPGNPIQNSFKDSPDCGFWSAEITEDEIKLKFYNIHDLSPNTYHKFLFCDETNIKRSDKLNHYRIRSSFKNKKTKNSLDSVDVSENLILELSKKILEGTKMDNPTLADKLLKEAVENCNKNTQKKSIPNCKVLSLHCENFLSIGELDIHFEDFHKQLVLAGDTGAGKTSLTEAIFWCVTGNTTKGVSANEVINTKINKDAVVTLDLEVNNKSYRIERKRLLSGTPSLLINIKENDEWIAFNKSSVKDTQNALYELIGVTDKEIKILSYFSAKNTLLFNALTGSEKSNVISRVIGTGDLDSLKDYSKVKRNDINNTVSKIDGVLSSLNQSIIRNKSKLASLSSDNTDATDIDSKRLELETLEDSIEDTSKIRENIVAIKSKMDIVSSDLSKCNLVYNNLKSETNKLELSILNTKKKLKQVMNAGNCYACEQTLLDNKMKDSLVAEVRSFTKQLNELEDIEIYSTKINELSTQHSTLSDKYSQLNDIILNNESKSRNIISLKNYLAEVKSKQPEPQLMDHILSDIKDTQKQIDTKSIELDSVLEEREIWSHFYSKLFKKDGDLSKLLNKQAITYLQDEIDKIISNVDLTVKMEDDLSLKAKFFGEYRDYNSLSNGQSRVCDIVIMVALNNIFSKLHNLESGVLGITIFDEILSFLSKEYVDISKSLLDQLITDKTIIITHDSRLISLFDSKILVKMVNDLSQYEFQY